ncbi:hypothetical protein [Prevotella histicola]|uniref:hypothetical protein n=1 Tax=Prevotella histicola TaxID=470565 RepID=UPI002880AB1C|nr:hypothetical protein [Prevotella histicola]
MFVMPVGDGQQGAFSSGGRGQVVVSMPTHPSQSVHTSQPISPHTAKDPTEKGNGSSALYLIIYSLFRRISASIAKTIVLTILRFLDFAFAR